MEPSRRLVVGQFVVCDQGVGLSAEGGRVLKAQIEVQLGLFALAIIPLLAGNLASPATDTSGNVNEGRLDGRG
jgi:hypothetical protein